MEAVKDFFAICLNMLMTIRFWDILDMAIIAYLIYWLISLVKKTNSMNVLKGIVVIVLVTWFANLLNLSVVSYILSQVLQIGFLALIVIFQPDIRRILERFGNTNGFIVNIFRRKIDSTDTDLAIKQVVLACADMAKSRTGALIVFERENNLDSYLKTGSMIDAEPTAELIKNIFYPKTPLHDGALIMRGGRIGSAASMLPLSSNLNLSRDLGMRHRAAVGISERTDAVVAVVSEETGSISVATGGMLKRHLAIDTFELLLRSELLPKEEPKKRWRPKGLKKGSGD